MIRCLVSFTPKVVLNKSDFRTERRLKDYPVHSPCLRCDMEVYRDQIRIPTCPVLPREIVVKSGGFPDWQSCMLLTICGAVGASLQQECYA